MIQSLPQSGIQVSEKIANKVFFQLNSSQQLAYSYPFLVKYTEIFDIFFLGFLRNGARFNSFLDFFPQSRVIFYPGIFLLKHASKLLHYSTVIFFWIFFVKKILFFEKNSGFRKNPTTSSSIGKKSRKTQFFGFYLTYQL